jgi:hypothetical protein
MSKLNIILKVSVLLLLIANGTAQAGSIEELAVKIFDAITVAKGRVEDTDQKKHVQKAEQKERVAQLAGFVPVDVVVRTRVEKSLP